MNYSAEKIFDLLENYCFSEYFCQCDVDCFLESIDAEAKGIDFEYGASKIVLWGRDWDYVIKIPFTGGVDEDDNYGDSYEDFNNAPNFAAARLAVKYGYNPDNLSCWDYCETEVKVYQAAKRIGVEKYFAETRYIGEVYDHPIYVQERCKMGPQSFRSYEEEKTFERDSREKDMCFCGNTDWAMDLYDYIANEELYKIIIKLIDNVFEITDIHSGNVGYRLNGCPVLVDYAGFHN